MGNVIGPPFLGGNRITTFVNGDQIFPAMLQALRSARETITFETYVFEAGEIPQQFANALADRARAGVQVRVILDAHGAAKSSRYHSMLRKAGVDLAIYHPVWRNLPRYNNRTHRKLLVVDGRIGFIGGVGIADEWTGNADSPNHWHDTHYRVEGPIVAELQGTFMDDWLKINKDLLHGRGYFPPLSSVGGTLATVFYSSPGHGSRNVEIMVELAIVSARKTLRIENAYFVPDRKTLDALVEAAHRGVRVQIIVPGEHIDVKAVRRASRARWGRLLDAGVEIYEYEPTMAHTKLLIADDLFVSVGSANLDYRSLRENEEANLNVLDAGFAAEQVRIFNQDLARSHRVQREENRRAVLRDLPMQALQAPVVPQL